MEEISVSEDVKYVMIPNIEKEIQVKEAFKKKRKGTLESFQFSLQKENTMECE